MSSQTAGEGDGGIVLVRAWRGEEEEEESCVSYDEARLACWAAARWRRTRGCMMGEGRKASKVEGR
jgi:hypothetical protein